MGKSEEVKYGIQDVPPVVSPLKDRVTYWGRIQTLFEGEDYTVKRIFMREGTQSSLEYHVKKSESYFVESGCLKVGVRVRRAENKSVILNAGDVIHIPVGLMHMRIAIFDTVIIEVSTKDDDADSHLVEDGKTYIHKDD